MARPNKIGLEYFSLDVNMDDEVELIKAQHGMKGFGILISMFQKIYGDKGYYIKWNNKNKILFSNKVSVDKNEVVSIINDCINWDIFNQKLYKKYNILTSKRIQKQYIGATYKRTKVKLYQEYLLIEDTDRDNIVCTTVSDNKNSDTSNVSDSKSTQSNKESNKDKEINKHADEISAVYNHWIKLLSDVNEARLTKKQKKTILTKIKKWSVDKLKQSISNYNEVYRSDYYYSHSFTMYKYIKQSNGAPRFLEGLDQKYDGDIWKDYKNKNKQDRQQDDGVTVV